MSKPELIIPSSPTPPSSLSYQAANPEINCSHPHLHMSYNPESHGNLLVLLLSRSLISHPIFSMTSVTALTSPFFHISYYKSHLTCLHRLLLFPLPIPSFHCSKRDLPKVQIQPCHSLLSILQCLYIVLGEISTLMRVVRSFLI